ncbi:MAG TPA: metallophosphoesterase [Spirochaetota bacterium]|nr:metallophosphoesterase [Spirochaetota bacterium]HOR43399.1 metallophosphoesterase [Spirochaetota bacterium]HPK56353.1 metallophosphoesterase [Spirochaetota bacterium]
MREGFIIFFSFALLVWIGVNIYLYNSLKHFFCSDVSRKIFLAVYIFLSMSFVLGRFLEKYSYTASVVPITAGSVFFAFVLYAFIGAAAIDSLNLIFKLSGRGILCPIKIKAVAVVIFSTAVCTAGFINSFNFAVRELVIYTEKNISADEFKIAYASDLHLGHIVGKRKLSFLVEKFNEFSPDTVILGGDTIDEDIEPVRRKRLNRKLSQIKSRYGTFAVLGNHEYIGGVDEAREYLNSNGIKLLEDSMVALPEGVVIAGRDDLMRNSYTGSKRKSISDIITVPQPDKFTILVDHQPKNLDEAEKHAIDLQLSGHTHHGQMFPFNFITSAIYEVSTGYVKRGKTSYYVSSGFGTWGPPVRLFRRPEIVLIRIIPKK